MYTSTLEAYLKEQRGKGQRAFAINEATRTLGVSKNAILASIARLMQKKELVSPVKGFYVWLPPHYALAGCIPAQELVPLVMEHLRVNYYLAFLSAAKHYGASHQKPMVFQVVVDKRMRHITCGNVRIWFTFKKNIAKIPIQKKAVPTGYLNISSPEATAMDMINFPRKSVGINNIATVLSELIESIDITRLIAMADSVGQKAWMQRMGYILAHIDTMMEDHQKNIIDALAKYLADKQTFYIPLSTVNPKAGFTRDKKWKIIENTTVESDL